MISKQQFLMWQPAAPQEKSTDTYYLSLANRLAAIAKDKGLFPHYPEKAVERAALALVGYYQDVICDAGVWRSFISENRRLYGFTVPFYDAGGDYLDYELNQIDVRFMVWYSLSMNYESRRVWNPMDSEITEGADEWWRVLDEAYDESPMPEDYRLTHELEVHAEEDSDAILKLGNWLFMHCYLMTPAYALTLAEIASEFDLSKEDGLIAFQKRMEQSMVEDPTGPLALYVREWLYLMIEGKMPSVANRSASAGEHKYYTSFTKATNGEIIKFFGNYQELNSFFIDALGWEKGEEHLSQLKKGNDFILMVNREKGMLLAHDIAKCIAHPLNPYYDKRYASEHAIELLTDRGCCPGDLLRYVCENGWLPDARFENSDDSQLVSDNWDFIARCYLQQYYRGD